MEQRPDRGRIIIVNFELGGSAVPPEMRKTKRPCVVLQNNKLNRGELVTVVPLSGAPPMAGDKQTHEMSHLSFRGWPFGWDGQGMPRFAQCEYVTSVSLRRCTDPYSKIRGERRYTKIKAAAVDIEAIERCVVWALGILPSRLVADVEEGNGEP